MNAPSFFVYLAVAAVVTYLIRALPLLLSRRPIANRRLVAFLHFIPYAVLGAMTVPACFYATGHVLSAAVGFLAAFVLAWNRRSLLTVAAGAVCGVLAAELLLPLL